VPTDVLNSDGTDKESTESDLKNPPLIKPTNKNEIIKVCSKDEDMFPVMCLALKYELWDESKTEEWAAWFRFSW